MRSRELVLLHGQPGSGSDWQLVVDRLPPWLRPLTLDRPGYASNPMAAGGFGHNARAVLAELDARGIGRAVLVGHSFGGGVALATARLAPERVEALILVACVGPGCINGWDRLLAAPLAGPVCALVAWWLTPRFARARLARIARLRDRPLAADEYVNWHVWAHARHDHGQLWRSFLVEQRALVRQLDRLAEELPAVRAPALLLADPGDTLVPLATAEALLAALPRARLELVERAGHHLPRRAAPAVADAIVGFLADLDDAQVPTEPSREG